MLSDVLSLVYWSELRFKDSEFSGKIKKAITHYKAAVIAYISGNPENCIRDALKATTIIRDVYSAEEKRLQQYHLMILAMQLILTVFLCSMTSLAFYKWGLPVCRRLWTKLRKKPPKEEVLRMRLKEIEELYKAGEISGIYYIKIKQRLEKELKN